MTDLREVVNAPRSMVRSGYEWRILPMHFPPWQTVTSHQGISQRWDLTRHPFDRIANVFLIAA